MGPSGTASLSAQVRSGLPSAEWMARVAVPDREVVLFVRQLTVLFRSGTPVHLALRILAEQTDNLKMAEVVHALYQLVDEGRYLSACLGKFPRIFGPIFIGLVKVGERTGALVRALEMLASWLERDLEVRQKVRSAMIYPIVVVMVAGLCCGILMTTLAPAFLGMFDRRGTSLPFPTLVVSKLVALQKQPLAWMVAIIVLVLLERWVRSIVRDPKKRARAFLVASYIPVLRSVVEAATWSRYCAASSIMMACGVNPQVLYKLSAQASGNPRLELDCEPLLREVLQGTTPSDHMRSHPELYPKLVAYSYSVGEDSGKSPQIADFLARSYALELDFQLTQFTNLLEPLLLAGTSLVLFFIILALLLPIYAQLNSLGA